MAYKLLKLNSFPPGEFKYEQTEGINRKFGGDGLSIEQQAKRVADFRAGNNLPRPSPQDCANDIEAFTCARLNNDPAYVYNTDTNTPNPLLTPRGGCAGCGAPVS